MSDPYNPDEAAVRNLLWGFKLLDETFAKIRQERAAKPKGMKCQHCGLEIEQIRDPWGYNNYRGDEYPWYHVKATEHREGEYVTYCGDDFGTEAEPEEKTNGIPV